MLTMRVMEEPFTSVVLVLLKIVILLITLLVMEEPFTSVVLVLVL